MKAIFVLLVVICSGYASVLGQALCQPGTHAKLPLILNLTYHKARPQLLSAGWQPYRTIRLNKAGTDPNTAYGNGELFWKKGYWEVEACAGTGPAPCAFLFTDVYGNKLRVTTEGEEDPKQKYFARISGYKFVCEEARETNICDLKNDPAKYNHSIVKVTGYFSRRFENSSLYDPSCESDQSIWVELGGKRSVDVIYCCGVTARPTRKKELEVEGIKLPLKQDANFEKYNKLLGGGKKVKATVIGSFFSGKKMQFSERPPFYGGYGHMGMSSLFIVQEVLSVEPIGFGNSL
jgi:hypothetical protein